MSDTMTEMNLDKFLAVLPKSHLANKQLTQLKPEQASDKEIQMCKSLMALTKAFPDWDK